MRKSKSLKNEIGRQKSTPAAHPSRRITSTKKTNPVQAEGCKNTTSPDHIDFKNLLKKSSLLFNQNPVAIALFSIPDIKCIDVNDAFSKITGYASEDVLKKSHNLFTIFADSEEEKKAFAELLHRGHLDNREFNLRHKNGNILTVLISAEIIKHKSKLHALVMMIDMTSYRLAEKTQRRNEEKYRTILETTEEGYYEIDLAGNFTFFNDPVCKLLGYSKNELLGLNNRAYMDKETAKKVFQAFNKVYRTGDPTKEFDWQIIRKDGSRRYIEQSATLIKDSAGKPTGFRGIFHDATERKK